MKPFVLAALAGLASLAAFTAQAAAPASQDACFLTRDLRGHTIGPGGHTIYLGVNGTDTYEVVTTDNCLAGVTASDPIVLQDRGLGKICNPLDLELRARGNQCIIGKLTKLTPDAAKALPKRLQP